MSYERIAHLPVTSAPSSPHYVVERDGIYERGMAYENEYWFKFTVVGRGQFPFDMLRHDRAFPADTTSAMNMAPGETRDERKAVREVVLVSSNPRPTWLPTFDRWASFGWVVKSDA